MSEALDSLFDTPELHFLAFDQDDALFIRMDRASYHRSIFLDRRISSLEVDPVSTAVAPLIEAARDREIARTGWIFQIAHCGSTLLARMIDSPGSGLVLREPPPLRQLGVLAASGSRGGDWTGRLKLTCALVARRFEPSKATVVKANVPVNFILREVLQFDSDAPVVLMYLPLEPYLLAILRDSRHRAWVDRVTRVLELALAARVGLGPRSDTAERAAALWLAQILMFDVVLRSNPRARSLDGEAFFASPMEAAEAAALHFGRSFEDAAGNADELRSTYSKDSSRPFNEAMRRQRQEDDRTVLRDDLSRARRWIDQAAALADLPESLDQRLFGTYSRLLG